MPFNNSAIKLDLRSLLDNIFKKKHQLFPIFVSCDPKSGGLTTSMAFLPISEAPVCKSEAGARLKLLFPKLTWAGKAWPLYGKFAGGRWAVGKGLGKYRRGG